MLPRTKAKASSWWLPVKVLVAAEVVSAAALYLLWRQTNRNQELRLQMATSDSRIMHAWLETYYKLGETANKDLKIREKDIELWRQQGKID